MIHSRILPQTTISSAVTPMALLLLLASACSSPSEPSDISGSEEDIRPIELAAGRLETRSNVPLQDVATDFAVVVWKTDAEENREYVMRHENGNPYLVRYVAGEWIYDLTLPDDTKQYLKYWDLSASSYTFSAYAPYYVTDPSTGTPRPAAELYPISFDAEGRVKITGLKGNRPSSGTPQWMTALHLRTSSPLLDSDLLSPSSSFPTLDALTRVVSPVFHRVMSEIEFRIYNNDGTSTLISDFTIELVDAEFSDNPSTIVTQGDFLGSGWINLSGPESELLKGTDVEVDATSRETALSLGILAEIPQNVAGKWLKVCFNIGSKTLTGYFRLPEWQDDAHTVPYAWDYDKKYIYTFALNGTQEIILMHLTIDDFITDKDDNIDVTEPEINW